MPQKRKTPAPNKTTAIKELPGKVIWLAVIVAAGLLVAAGFSLAAFGSDSDESDLGVAESFFELVTEQEGLTITARVRDPYVDRWTNAVHWKYMIIDVGENCGRENFSNHPPNYPGIHYSNRLVLPDDPDRQAAYRNRWVCFEAVSGYRTRHILHDIDTGNPIVAVKRLTIPGGRGSYLQASANENVTYRIGRVHIAQTTVFVSAEKPPPYPWLQAGTDCEQMFKGNYFASLDEDGDPVTAPLQFEEITVSSRATVVTHREGFTAFIYCFEATDSDGNQTYVQATPDLELIVYRRTQENFVGVGVSKKTAHFRLLNVSGYVDWAISPGFFKENHEAANCSAKSYSSHQPPWQKYRAGGFNDNPVWAQEYWWPAGVAPPIYMPGYRVQEEDTYQGDKSTYYCVRAVDQLGNHYYRLIPTD